MKRSRKILDKPGIYQISATKNDKIYIGSSFSIKRRIRTHLNLLKRNEHINKHLQNYFNKFGESSLIFSVVKYIEFTIETKNEKLKKLQELENFYIKEKGLFSDDGKALGFNISSDATKFFIGKKHTKEAKKNISIGHKGQIPWIAGKHHSEETKQILKIKSAVNKGKKRTEEQKKKIRDAAQKGREEKIKKYGKYYFHGKTLSEDTKKKISEAHKKLVGERNPFYGKTHSQETKEKISNAKKGRKWAEETREKLKDAHKKEKNGMYNKTHSEEAKEKMKKAWELRREKAVVFYIQY